MFMFRSKKEIIELVWSNLRPRCCDTLKSTQFLIQLFIAMWQGYPEKEETAMSTNLKRKDLFFSFLDLFYKICELYCWKGGDCNEHEPYYDLKVEGSHAKIDENIANYFLKNIAKTSVLYLLNVCTCLRLQKKHKWVRAVKSKLNA